MSKNIEVVGGEWITPEDANGNKLPKIFTKTRRREGENKGQELREVVPEHRLAALFRQDWELAGAQAIKMRPTNARVTVSRLDW